MTARLPLAVLLLALAGCDRAGIDPVETGLVVQSPDLGEVLTQSDVTLRVRARGDGDVVRVEVAGQDARVEGDAFAADLQLARGLTAIPLDGFDADGALVVTDTAYALRAEPSTEPAALEGVGGGALTATALSGGDVLLAGGEPPPGADRAGATLVQTVEGRLVAARTGPLQSARLGHTATRLPDGTVLLLGGATRRTPRAPADFLQSAELVRLDPALSSRAVLIEGDLTQRAGHVTRLVEVDGAWYLFLIGGLVPSSPPTTLPTVDVVRFEPGSSPRLVVLTPRGGAGDEPRFRAPDPLLLDVRAAPTGEAASLLYGLDGAGALAAALTWSPPGPPAYPVGLDVADGAPPLATARTGAAGAALSGGLFLVSGGRTDAGAALASIEAVAPAAGRTFDLGAAAGLTRARADHAATSLGPGRMLTIGGYDGGGVALLDPEITTL